MNRRNFLRGIGAAVATLAVTTKLATARLDLVNPMLDGDFTTENLRYKVTERYSRGWTDPKAIFGTSDRFYEEAPVSLPRATQVDIEQLRQYTHSNSWYLKVDNEPGIKKYFRRAFQRIS